MQGKNNDSLTLGYNSFSSLPRHLRNQFSQGQLHQQGEYIANRCARGFITKMVSSLFIFPIIFLSFILGSIDSPYLKSSISDSLTIIYQQLLSLNFFSGDVLGAIFALLLLAFIFFLGLVKFTDFIQNFKECRLQNSDHYRFGLVLRENALIYRACGSNWKGEQVLYIPKERLIEAQAVNTHSEEYQYKKIRLTYLDNQQQQIVFIDAIALEAELTTLIKKINQWKNKASTGLKENLHKDDNPELIDTQYIAPWKIAIGYISLCFIAYSIAPINYPNKGYLKIQTNVDSYNIRLNKKWAYYNSPERLEVNPGQYHIAIHSDGFNTWEDNIEIKVRNQLIIKAKLSKQE